MVGQEHRGGGGLNHRSSTFHEGVARGCADVPRAMGQCRQQSAWALRNLQEAYGHALDNRKKAVQTYFDIIRINQQERARQRRPRPTCEQLREYARVRAPERLAAHEFDSAAGTLVWPGVLQGSQFAAERGAIDRLMTDRARSGGNTGDAAAKVKLLLAGLKIKLKQQIWTLSSMDYIAAQRFLAGETGSLPARTRDRCVRRAGQTGRQVITLTKRAPLWMADLARRCSTVQGKQRDGELQARRRLGPLTNGSSFR